MIDIGHLSLIEWEVVTSIYLVGRRYKWWYTDKHVPSVSSQSIRGIVINLSATASLEKSLLWKLTALPCCSNQLVDERLILSGMGLRNQEIDEHLSMTPINQKDKSSVSLWAVCYSMGDRHSPCMQTLSPICQGHNNSPGRPPLHHCVNNKCNWSQYWFIYFGEKRCPKRAVQAIKKIWSLNISYLTFWRRFL